MKNSEEHFDSPAKKSQRILSRVDNDSETIGTSSLVRSAEKARDHMMGKDSDSDDPIEVWGKRIGRILSLFAVGFLLIYLYNTYIA